MTTKIKIYKTANAINTAVTLGSSLLMNKLHELQHTGALHTEKEYYDNYQDRLINDGCLTENSVVFRTETGTEIEILDAIIDVTKQNNIVETKLVNRAGTVKERIQEDDYNVVVKGSLINDKDKFPYVDLVTLNKILSDAKSIDVASVFTHIFGIDKLVFKTANFNQSNWQSFNVMPFTLIFTSDTDYDFLVK